MVCPHARTPCAVASAADNVRSALNYAATRTIRRTRGPDNDGDEVVEDPRRRKTPFGRLEESSKERDSLPRGAETPRIGERGAS